MTDPEPCRGYRPVLEQGTWCWYRTTRSQVIGRSKKTGAEIRSGTAIDRIVTNATTIEEAKKQLDRALSKPKTEPPVKAGPNQINMFDGG